MKKHIAGFVCLALLFCTSLTNTFASNPGSGNIESGGGGLGSGTSSNFWSPGNDGVRITIVDSDTGVSVSPSVDFSNRDRSSVTFHFGKVSKMQYRSGSLLSLQLGEYNSIIPTLSMPIIMSSNSLGHSDIQKIKRYFCGEYACRMVSDSTGFNYDRLLSGNYKLLLEPIAYFTFNDEFYCMSATEAALYDEALSGGLRAKLPTVLFQNLPLAMFLEFDDLGFNAWGGPDTGRQTNADIINYLGIGIVYFTEHEIELTGSIEAPDVEYRVDTDVITSVTVRSDTRLTPSNPADVKFYVDGWSYTVHDIVMPADSSQIVWLKWHTPSTPRDITVRVSVSGAYTAQDTFLARIVSLDERIPPDPLATDTNSSYRVPSLPSNSQRTSSYWSVWHCYWVSDWVWHSDRDEDGNDNGHWCDHGDWEYALDTYSASLSATMSLMPDDIVPTAAGKMMKSGYGVKIDVSSSLYTNAPSNHVTSTQTAFTVFPEFQYQTYLRLLQLSRSGSMNANFEFKPNTFSTYNRKTHFTPVWYPDATHYTAYTQVWDTWTPDGMLSINLDDYITIQGSIYDDWYTSRD